MLLWALLLGLLCGGFSLPIGTHVRLLHVERPNDPALEWIAALALAFPGAWVLAAACRWFCRNLRFSDHRHAAFSGEGAEILGWWILCVVAGISWRGPGIEEIALGVALYLLGLWGSLNLMRWFVAHLDLNSGERLSFQGTYRELLGWEILLGLSILTIVGWAWVLAAMYRWMAHSTRAANAALRFHGLGGQILWRTVVAILFMLPVVTIPWALLWYTRWLVQSVTIEGQLAVA